MGLDEKIKKFNRLLFFVGGFALIFVMLLTVADVILRRFAGPIIGTYELVGLAGAVVIGFCIPYTTSSKMHVTVDFLTMKLPKRSLVVTRLFTRAIGIFFWAFTGYNLFLFGKRLLTSGEVSLTLQLPFYPIAYGIGICCFLQVVTQIVEFVYVLRGER
jgi:TRAP-type C4-dicarboxylate transport system permease small subunit